MDHNFNRCPNCRCDLRTGEKLTNNQNNQINEQYLYNGENLHFSYFGDEYDIFIVDDLESTFVNNEEIDNEDDY